MWSGALVLLFALFASAAQQCPTSSHQQIPRTSSDSFDQIQSRGSPVVLSSQLAARLLPSLARDDWSPSTVTELLSVTNASGRFVSVESSRFGRYFKYYGKSR